MILGTPPRMMIDDHCTRLKWPWVSMNCGILPIFMHLQSETIGFMESMSGAYGLHWHGCWHWCSCRRHGSVHAVCAGTSGMVCLGENTQIPWCITIFSKTIAVLDSFSGYTPCSHIHSLFHPSLSTHTVTTFKYVEGGPDREALEVVWIPVRIFKCSCRMFNGIPYV